MMFIIVFFISFFMVMQVSALQKMIVSKPIESLWITSHQQPCKFVAPWNSIHVPDHDTQLLYGERVELLEEGDDNWIKVRTFDQPWYDRNKGAWAHCSGWIKRDAVQAIEAYPSRNLVVTEQYATTFAQAAQGSAVLLTLSFGSLLQGENCGDGWHKIMLLNGNEGFIRSSAVNAIDAFSINKPELLRVALVNRFKSFLKSPYCWGGRSAYCRDNKTAVTSVDCSSLINLIYLSCGLMIPRNASCQFRCAAPIDPKDLLPGDVIFTKSEDKNFQRVDHILMYLGDGFVGECSGFETRAEKDRTTFITHELERFGVSLKEIANGHRTEAHGMHYACEISVASFLSDPLLRQRLREALVR